MKRSLLSLLVIGVVATAALGLSRSFFSDTETSSANTFEAGAIDLKIDNTSYLNGALNQGTTWTSSDLTNQLFFNFTDIKPDNEGEDTISLIVNTNDAWVCSDITLTKNDDNNSTEPELGDGDIQDDPENNFDGELAQNINMVFWIDDGDNVLELTESASKILAQGPASDVLNSSWALADSLGNKLGLPIGNPAAGNTTYHIGKAWCFGNLTLTPVADGAVQNPTLDSGVSCDGTQLNNITQTDLINADIKFTAEQHRNNPEFQCKHGWDLYGACTVTFTCTSGCGGSYPHTLNLVNMDLNTGNFSGNGFYNPNNAYTWDITGNLSGTNISFNIDYTGLNPSYFVNGVGVVNNDGTISGTSTAPGQAHTWVTTTGCAKEY
ncbi:hypothetical protein A2961_01365 [Candidatus Woesebacteria bacterium RIFCSPLOWO2_01_FULL_39_21]|uniref:Uncharacterized protein n=1 Tax=Candidatus Woesebacteria bacterium RIFCSPLOWO2_01_FULL_39_21 TaxID=1802519 RepID=A0A1F8BKS4_9BACT|nr:MAG: hypothetical protein A2961_01365 [Candidatus Woesebacteria bacterium RIFCSPLOWO2_01_FULL_39_21]